MSSLCNLLALKQRKLLVPAVRDAVCDGSLSQPFGSRLSDSAWLTTVTRQQPQQPPSEQWPGSSLSPLKAVL